MGKKLGLARADVIAAAVTVTNKGGIENLNLRDVAEQLGVRSPSLYHHVDGLKGLRREVALFAAKQLSDALSQAIDSDDDQQSLYALARAYRNFAKKQPGLLGATFPAPRPGEDDELYNAMASVVSIFLEILAKHGIDGDRAIHAIRNLRSYLHGFVDLETRGGFGMPQNIEESFNSGLAIMIDGIMKLAPNKAAASLKKK